MNISETDLPNIKTGQFGIANFNAMPEQSYLFEISTISFIPEISQGVVSYPVNRAEGSGDRAEGSGDRAEGSGDRTELLD